MIVFVIENFVSDAVEQDCEEEVIDARIKGVLVEIFRDVKVTGEIWIKANLS